jgi:hypothetical protein
MTSKVGSFGIAVVVALFFLSHGMTACAQVATLPTSSPTTSSVISCFGEFTGTGFTCRINAATGQRARITGFTVSSFLNGTSGGTGTVTITGLTGSQQLNYVFGVSTGYSVLNVEFPVPLASAVGGSLTLSVPQIGNSTVAGTMNGVSF